jgi:hypothetical protein
LDAKDPDSIDRKVFGENARLAAYYWFSNIHWWNDGQAVVFCLIKAAGLSNVDPGWGFWDDRWFRVPESVKSPRPRTIPVTLSSGGGTNISESGLSVPDVIH